jgi:signal transduction histidine kinase
VPLAAPTLSHMGRFATLLGRHGVDALIAVGVLESALAVALAGDADGAPQVPAWIAVVAATGVSMPLLARHRFGFGAPSAVLLLAAAASFVDGRIVTFPVGIYVVGMVAAMSLGGLAEPRRARQGFGVVVLSTFVVSLNDPLHDLGELLFTPLLFALFWVGGYALRQRIAEAEAAQRRALQAEYAHRDGERRAVAEERARIAREMHDILGHSLSVMTVQTAAVRRLLAPEQVRERGALRAVEDTGRDALADMRRLVAVLRDPGDGISLVPAPGFTDLPRLLEHTRESGLPVELRIDGTPVRLSAGVELAAYRVVQEGLTNAIRHSGANRAQVHVCYGEGHLDVEVVDDGPGRAPETPDEAGYGLLGMRERVTAYRGTLDAGPRPGGGFRLHARLPAGP